MISCRSIRLALDRTGRFQIWNPARGMWPDILYLHKQWFQNQTANNNKNNSSAARFIFYLPRYSNDRGVKPQAFEPQRSYYSAVMGSFLQSDNLNLDMKYSTRCRLLREGCQKECKMEPIFSRNSCATWRWYSSIRYARLQTS
jgi:hypothetical protein